GASSAGTIGLALFLLGLGWNFCYLSASALLVSGARLEERARVQGNADLLNWSVAAVGALGGGFLTGSLGFSAVAWAGLAVSVVPLAAAVLLARARTEARPAGA
ncbi:MAG TPA: hypothetical protein VNT60_08595, partial [Deinococcales bacterium]|nr:hypothetical protein [Deinococcales bacterium]